MQEYRDVMDWILGACQRLRKMVVGGSKQSREGDNARRWGRRQKVKLPDGGDQDLTMLTQTRQLISTAC